MDDQQRLRVCPRTGPETWRDLVPRFGKHVDGGLIVEAEQAVEAAHRALGECFARAPDAAQSADEKLRDLVMLHDLVVAKQLALNAANALAHVPLMEAAINMRIASAERCSTTPRSVSDYQCAADLIEIAMNAGVPMPDHAPAPMFSIPCGAAQERAYWHRTDPMADYYAFASFVRGDRDVSMRERLFCASDELALHQAKTLAVAARNRTVADAQSRVVSDAHSLRLELRTDARSVRLGARSVRRTRDHPDRRALCETDQVGRASRSAEAAPRGSPRSGARFVPCAWGEPSGIMINR